MGFWDRARARAVRSHKVDITKKHQTTSKTTLDESSFEGSFWLRIDLNFSFVQNLQHFFAGLAPQIGSRYLAD